MSVSRFFAYSPDVTYENLQAALKDLYGNKIEALKIPGYIFELDKSFVRLIRKDLENLKANVPAETKNIRPNEYDLLASVLKSIVDGNEIEEKDENLLRKCTLPQTKCALQYIRFLKACRHYGQRIEGILRKLKDKLPEHDLALRDSGSKQPREDVNAVNKHIYNLRTTLDLLLDTFELNRALKVYGLVAVTLSNTTIRWSYAEGVRQEFLQSVTMVTFTQQGPLYSSLRDSLSNAIDVSSSSEKDEMRSSLKMKI